MDALKWFLMKKTAEYEIILETLQSEILEKNNSWSFSGHHASFLCCSHTLPQTLSHSSVAWKPGLCSFLQGLGGNLPISVAAN